MAFKKYGISWPDEYDALSVELICFRDGGTAHNEDGMTRASHFKNITRILWGRSSSKPYTWNPWAESMLEAVISHRFVELSGCASSGKTAFIALWLLVNWMCDPKNTLCLVTSTSLKESRMRVWGAIVEFYAAAQTSIKEQKLPGIAGKLVDSIGAIRTHDGTNSYPDKCGIHLITGEKSKEKENIGKLIGLKQKKVFFGCDEMPELSPALVEAARSNLITNPFFQMIGSGNFKSLYDPFGRACTPKNGWGSVNLDTDQWETEYGICLRFDGLKSPNVLAGENKYPGIFNISHIEEMKKYPGEHTSAFWRMCRSFPCPESDADKIFSEADFLKGRVTETVRWTERPIPCASLDPAFVTGGDDAICKTALVGMSTEGKKVLQFTGQPKLKEDIRKKDQSRSVQVARGFAKVCIDASIEDKHAAYDVSGGGAPFGGLLSEVWSNRPLGVQFGGAASDRMVRDGKTAKQMYANRVTELWFSLREFIQSGQIKGLDEETLVEMRERKFETVKGGDGIRLRVESKTDMKARIGKSPDKSDAAAIMLELARERLGLSLHGLEGRHAAGHHTFKQQARRINQSFTPTYSDDV